MKISTPAKLLVISSFIALTTSPLALAHPVRTASDGCHYCKTNCDKWNVPWNERHCHNNYKEEGKGLFLHTHSSATHTHENGLIKVSGSNK